jgi:hypothetical protein
LQFNVTPAFDISTPAVHDICMTVGVLNEIYAKQVQGLGGALLMSVQRSDEESFVVAYSQI